MVANKIIPAACACENGKYLKSIIDNSVIISGEIIGSIQSTILATLAKSYDKARKTIPKKLFQQILTKKR